jgi:YHS domain-containing protein
MDDLVSLEQQIKERLASAQSRHQQSQEALRRAMTARDERVKLFEEAARRLMEQVIRPRIVTLSSCFPNAHIEKSGPVENKCTCRFDHTGEYPASTQLEISLSTGGDVQNVIVTYSLDILPVFFQFEGHNQLELPLDASEDEAVASWLDERLLGFVDTYLQLPLVEQYQQENISIDPVCGMRINCSDAGASAVYKGKTYHFCVEECQQKFLHDPVRYAGG